MRGHLLAYAVGAVAGMALSGAVLAQPAAPTLAPLAQCEVERVALQAQVVELRAQLVALQTQTDRQALATERERITPTADGYQWDWSALRFVPVTPTATQTEPK